MAHIIQYITDTVGYSVQVNETILLLLIYKLLCADLGLVFALINIHHRVELEHQASKNKTYCEANCEVLYLE